MGGLHMEIGQPFFKLFSKPLAFAQTLNGSLIETLEADKLRFGFSTAEREDYLFQVSILLLRDLIYQINLA